MNRIVSSLVFASALVTASAAHADPGVPSPPGLPTPGAPAPTAAAPASPDKAQDERDLRGGVFQLDVGLGRLGGNFAKDAPVGVFGVSLGIRGGYTVSQSTTLLGGVKLGLGSMTDCPRDTKCSSYSASVPLTVEYAFDSADRGAFIEGGLSLFNVYHMTPPQASITMFSPVDATAGFGYRIPMKVSKDVTRHFDIALRGTFGAFTHGNVTLGNDSVGGAIDDLALHHEVTLAMGVRF